jgi:hypothetical protein
MDRALYATVPTPPWEERFEPLGSHSNKVQCVVCGASGYSPPNEKAENTYPRWWTIRHRIHVRCTCGKALSVAGIGHHRSSMAQHGTPCPPVD